MINLPKCPHCEKLLAMIVTHGAGVVLGEGPAHYQELTVYLCPETMSPQKPIWVEVLEVA
jgi:hypothetical protein